MDHRPKPALFRDPEPPRCNPAKALACMPAIPSESRCRHPDQDLQGQNVDGQRGLHSLTSSPSARINRHRPVASGTQFRFSGLIKGLITLKWLGTRLGDDALFAGFGAGWGRDSGSGPGRGGLDFGGGNDIAWVIAWLRAFGLVLLWATPLRGVDLCLSRRGRGLVLG